MSLCRTRTAAAAAAAPLSISAVNSVATGKPSFWTRMRQLQEDDIAVAVLVYELTPQGMVVTCDGHRGFIQWRDAVGALKEGRLSGGRVRRGDETLVGQQLLAVVHRLHEASGTLELKCRPHPGRDVQVGQAVTGVVRFLQSDGAWVDYGDTNDGFLSIRHVSREPVKDLGNHLAVGQELKVFVRSVDREQGRVTLTLLGGTSPSAPETPSASAPRKRLLLFGPADARAGEQEEEGTSLGARGASAWRPAKEEKARIRAGADFKVGKLVSGVVRSVHSYGAFVDYGDTREGLLHISEVSHETVSDLGKVLTVGEELKALLVRRVLDTQRVELSTKWLEREEGAMLRQPRLLYDTAEAAAEAKAMGALRSTSQRRKGRDALDARGQLEPDLRFQEGQLVTCVVRTIHAFGAFVDFGDTNQGLLRTRDFSQHAVKHLHEHLAVGDELMAILQNRVVGAQRAILSTRWLEREDGAMLRQPRLLYDTKEEVAEARRLRAPSSTSRRRQAIGQPGSEAGPSSSPDAEDKGSSRAHRAVLQPDSAFQVGQMVTGVVKSVHAYGAFVDYGDAREGLLHVSKISRKIVTDPGVYLSVGETIQAILYSRDLDTQRVMLSTKWLEREPGAMLRKPRLLYDTAEEAAAKQLGVQEGGDLEFRQKLQADSVYQVGQLVTGVVTNITAVGAFVDYGDSKDGLLHVRQFSQTPVKAVGDYLAVGDVVKAILLLRDVDSQRVELSTKRLEREPGTMLRKPHLLYDSAEEAAEAEVQSAQNKVQRRQTRTSLDDKETPRAVTKFKAGQLVTGVVHGVTPYGAFVDYGDSTHGLLHISHFSQGSFTALGDHLAVGDELKAILLSQDLGTGRVTLSTKWLERQKGAMLRTPRLLYDTAEEAKEAQRRAGLDRHERKEMARQAAGPQGTPTEEAGFWARLQQLRLEGVAVSVIVKQINTKGVIVTYEGRQSFLRRSPKEVSDWAAQGDEALVGQQLSVYIQVSDQNTGQITFRRRGRPVVHAKVGQILDGRVRGVTGYGVFVNVGDVRVGLLHATRVSQVPVEDLNEHFATGDEIKVLVLSVKAGLTTLSTRHLEREPGGMLRRPRLLWDTEEEAAAELARQEHGAVASEGQ